MPDFFLGKLAATRRKLLKQIQSRTLYAAKVCFGWQFELKFSFMGKGPLSNERRIPAITTRKYLLRRYCLLTPV